MKYISPSLEKINTKLHSYADMHDHQAVLLGHKTISNRTIWIYSLLFHKPNVNMKNKNKARKLTMAEVVK